MRLMSCTYLCRVNYEQTHSLTRIQLLMIISYQTFTMCAQKPISIVPNVIGLKNTKSQNDNII